MPDSAHQQRGHLLQAPEGMCSSAGEDQVLTLDEQPQQVQEAVSQLLPLATLAPALCVQRMVADALNHPAQACLCGRCLWQRALLVSSRRQQLSIVGGGT